MKTNKNLSIHDEPSFISSLLVAIIGYSITVVSFTFKLPQIYRMIQTKSTKSISTLSNYFDFYSILFQGLYSLHKKLSLVIYLEYFSTSLQNITIIFLSWKYSSYKMSSLSFIFRTIFLITTPYIIVISLLNNGNYIHDYIWNIMVLCGLPFMTISRLSQMKEIYVNKDVGSVSLMSFVLRAMKNFLKVFVIMFEVINFPLIINQLYYGILTMGVIVMILRYRNYKEEKIKEEECNVDIVEKSI